MTKTTKAWDLDAGTNLRRAWGRDGKTMMALLVAGEGEVSAWLASQGRESDSPLTPEDLVPLLRETRHPPISVRFWWALSLSRSSQAMAVSGVSPSGTVTVRSKRPISPKLPDIVRVEREASPDTFSQVMKLMSAVKILMPPHLRAVAIARTISTGKVHPHSEEARKTMIRRERRRAERSGVMLAALKRGKAGRPKKSGQ